MKVPAAAVALCGFVIAATACAPSVEQEPIADETVSPQADVENLEATINAHWEAFNAGDRGLPPEAVPLVKLDHGPNRGSRRTL